MAFWKGLQVQMLGGFELSFEGKTLLLNKKQTAKPVQLLQLLLDNREAGVSRRAVVEALYGQESEIDVDNSLNVTVSQLRKLLRDTPLPKENCIHVRVDRYFFQSSFPVTIDTEEVIRLRQAADLATGSDRMSILYQLCDLYNGRFLPDLDGEDWVEIARAHYQRIYKESVEELCRALSEQHSYGELLRLAGFAAKLFPFDEWQVWQQESLLNQGRVRDARALYQQVEKLYLTELDAPPPERMRARLRFDTVPWRKAEDIRQVRDQLAETERNGPCCLPFPGFWDAYHLTGRVCRETGQPFCLLLCTLEDREDRTADPVQFQTAMEHLETALVDSLRSQDACTRYSRSQYLAVLVGLREEECEATVHRVTEQFKKLAGSTKLRLACQVLSGEDAESPAP